MRDLVRFFALAYAISWVIWAPLWVPGLEFARFLPMPAMHALGGYGPMLAALALTFDQQGGSGLAKLLWSAVDVWRSPALALAALAGPFLLLAGATAGLTLLLPAEPLGAPMHSANYPWLAPLPLFLFYLVTFAVGEEIGWRGYALPRLEQRLSPLGATVVLSLGWALWHWPLFVYWPGFASFGFPQPTSAAATPCR